MSWPSRRSAEPGHGFPGPIAWMAGHSVAANLLMLVFLVGGLIWGFFFTPDDYRQGSTVKIIYLHVPSAMMAINIWAMMLVTSLIWIIRRLHGLQKEVLQSGPCWEPPYFIYNNCRKSLD